jgi:hypothetical protein
MTAADDIIRLLRKAGPLRANEIAVTLRKPKQTVHSALHMLETAGLVRSDGTPGNKRFGGPWTLTPESENSPKPSPKKSETSPKKSEAGNAFSPSPGPSGLGGRGTGASPKPSPNPNGVATGHWRRTDVVGRDGARMWVDPDGYHVSVRNMGAKLRAELGITDPVPLPIDPPENDNDPIVGPERAAEWEAAIDSAVRSGLRHTAACYRARTPQRGCPWCEHIMVAVGKWRALENLS